MRSPGRVLLDTHVWLWLALGVANRISTPALKMLEDAGQTAGILVSVVSIWEIALLVSRQRVVLPLPLSSWVDLALSRPEIRLVGINRPDMIIDSVNLPGELHADPTDRFLIATARARRATLATHDERIISYGAAGHVSVLAV